MNGEHVQYLLVCQGVQEVLEVQVTLRHPK